MGLLAKLEQRNSPENPQTSLSNPASWLYEAFGAAPSPTGVSMNNVKAMNIAAWLQGVSIIAKGVAVTPLKVFEEQERGRRTAKETRVYHLLKTRPNPEMTAYQYHESMTAAWAGWGNAYAEIELQRGGDPEALWWLHPGDCRVVRTGGSSDQLVRLGLRPRSKHVAVRSDYKPEGDYLYHNGEVYLPPGKYIHIPGLSLDGLAGSNIAGHAKRTLALSYTLQEFISRFFASGAKAATIVQPKEGHSMGLKARENIVANLSKQLGGLSGAHRMAAVEAGVDIHTIGVSPQAAEFLGLDQDQTKKIAQFLDIPLYRMGADDKGQSYASVAAKQLDLLTWTHLPTLVRTQQVYTWELMPDRRKPMQERRFYAEFSYNAQLRAEPKVRAETDALRVRNGLATRNEIRAEHNMNPIDVPEADMLFAELNLMPLGVEPPAAGEPRSFGVQVGPGSTLEERRMAERRGRLALLRQRLRRAQMPAFRRMAERILNREREEVRRFISRAFSSSEPATRLLALLAEYYGREDDGSYTQTPLLAAITREVAPLALGFAEVISGAISDELNREAPVTPQVEQFAQDFAETYSVLHARSSSGQLATIIENFPADGEPEELRDALLARLDKWEEDRAQRIADNLTVRAGGALGVEIYAAAGVVSLVWVGGDCPLCSSLNGQVVGVRQAFLSAGATVTAEGANPFTVDRDISHPPLHPPTCDCVILAA